MNPLMQLYLQQQHPGQSYWQTQYQAEEGVRSPQDLYNLTQMETQRYGAAGQDKYFMAQALARDYGLSSAHVGMDVLNAQDYLKNMNPNSDQYRMVSQYMQGGSLEYIGLANDVANNKYTKNGRFDAAAAAAEFKKETGRNIGGNLGGNATQGQFLTQLAQEGAPEGGTNAARSIEQSQANVANNYTEISQKMSASIAALDSFNAGVSSTARGLTNLAAMLPGGGPNAAGGRVGAAIPIVGGALGGALQTAGMVGFGLMGAAHLARVGKTAYTAVRGGGGAVNIMRSLLGGGKAVAPAAEEAVSEGSNVLQFVPRVAQPALSVVPEAGPEATAPVVGAGGGVLSSIIGPAAAGLAGYMGLAGLQQFGSGATASGGLPADAARAALLMNPLTFLSSTLFQGARGMTNNPLLRNTGFGQAVSGANNWASQNIPGFDWLFGHTNPAATIQPGNATAPVTTANGAKPGTADVNPILTALNTSNTTLSDISSKLGNIYTENKTSNDTLGKILASVSTQTAGSTDKAYQARYGVTKTVANPNSPTTSTLNYGGSPGVVDGGGTPGSSAAISGGGGATSGTGFDSIVGGMAWTNGQGFGVVSPGVDQSIYNYGASYGLPQGHTGVDVDVPRGTPVYTPLAGVVMVAGGADESGGSYFVDDPSGAGVAATGELKIGVPNGDGDMLILGHLSKILVRVGDKVKPGQLVAYSGTANGDHVHVEYRKKTPGKNSGYTLVDPMQQINSMVPKTPSGGGGGAAAGPVSSGANGGATSKWRPQIEQAARAVGINPDVVQAIMMKENPSGDPSDVSVAGAIGLMQVMPFNFLPGEDTSDPYTQILAGARYLKGQYDKYGNWNSAAAGYLGAVDKNGNPSTAADQYGTTGIQYAKDFQSNLAKLRAGGTVTDRPGNTSASMRAITANNAEKNLGLTSDTGTGTNPSGSIEFAPLTVNVVYPDGTTVTSKLALTSKNPYNGIRQYTSRAVGRG
jgi:murein DD-endopeptidase MepM/ murein hydrolase activator NlpD